MRKELKVDVLIVFAVWFVGLFVAAVMKEGFPVDLTLGALRGLALIWIVGGAAGVAAAFLLAELKNHVWQSLVRRDADAEAEAVVIDGEEDGDDKLETRVRLPRPDAIVLAAGPGDNPLHARDWWGDYAKRFRAHAALLDEAYRLMETRPGMPAGISQHDGETLVSHAVRVTAQAIEKSKGWKFDGVRNSKGATVVPAKDAKHNVNLGNGDPLHDPMLVLAAFTHDIGKVECLLTPKDGEPVMLPGHEEKGAALLRRLPAFEHLSRADRADLTLIVRNYHHPTLMPIAPWVTDRAMSLTCLLSVSDAAHRAPKDAQPVADRVPSASRPLAASAPATSVDKTQPLHYQSAGGADVLDLFCEAVSGPGAVNGQNVGTRVAWKYGEWLYVMLRRMAASVGRLADDSSLGTKADITHPFVQDLLAGLAADGNLFLGTPPRQPARAVWKAVSSSNGAAASDQPHYDVIVVKASAVPGVANMQDCAYAPLLVDKDGGGLDMHASAGNATVVTSARNTASIQTRQGVSGDVKVDRQTVTGGALLAYARLEPRKPGVAAAVDKQGNKLWIFDLDAIQRAFVVDVTHLPEGVSLRTSTKTGKRGLVVKRG